MDKYDVTALCPHSLVSHFGKKKYFYSLPISTKILLTILYTTKGVIGDVHHLTASSGTFNASVEKKLLLVHWDTKGVLDLPLETVNGDRSLTFHRSDRTSHVLGGGLCFLKLFLLAT